MKKLLIILLLIVGCAPQTTTTFYIGMTEDEFQMKNPNIERLDFTYDSGEKGFFSDVYKGYSMETAVDKSKKTKLGYWYTETTKGLVSYLSFGLFSDFYYEFDHKADTLNLVRFEFWEIDYSKYPNSKPE